MSGIEKSRIRAKMPGRQMNMFLNIRSITDHPVSTQSTELAAVVERSRR